MKHTWSTKLGVFSAVVIVLFIHICIALVRHLKSDCIDLQFQSYIYDSIMDSNMFINC